ncbi:hypothetical protein EBQ93_04955 [bacterium]|jgi:bifunctional UDP-N-acetylglucosamine pyrophosphorylase/glucosamine-1-phosphate N-acetyltransferase|nr:hypothetical protein [bacterium]
MYKRIQAVILAGGKSTKFHTGKTKLLERVCGKEIILYPLELLQKLHIPTTVVLGYQQERIIETLKEHHFIEPKISFVQQTEQLGTGHAAKISQSSWNHDHILILNADIPLLDEHVISKLYKKHINTDADVSFVTSHTPEFDSNAYFKILINDNKIHAIAPEDYQADQENMCCVEAGIYIFKRTFLEENIHLLTPSALTNEYYLQQLIQIASNKNAKIVSTPANFECIRSVNTLEELWVVEHIKRSQLIKQWMEKGVRFAHTLNVMIDVDVTIEPGCYISAGVHLLGKTVVKQNANIGAFAFIKNSIIGQDAKIKSHTVIRNSFIGDNAIIQPFSHIHDQTINAKVKTPEKTFSPLFTGAIKTHTYEL